MIKINNEADAAVKAPRQAYENTCTRCLGDAVKAMLTSSEGHTNKPIVVIVRQIHDWSKRYNDVKNKDLKIICNPLEWKITDSGLQYKESYSNQEWLGAGGIPEGRAINLFEVDSKLSGSPAPVPSYSNPFSDSAVDSTKTAIRYIETIDPASAAKLKSVLASGADDASIGLTFVRQFEDGKVGFAGSLATIVMADLSLFVFCLVCRHLSGGHEGAPPRRRHLQLVDLQLLWLLMSRSLWRVSRGA